LSVGLFTRLSANPSDRTKKRPWVSNLTLGLAKAWDSGGREGTLLSLHCNGLCRISLQVVYKPSAIQTAYDFVRTAVRRQSMRERFWSSDGLHVVHHFEADNFSSRAKHQIDQLSTCKEAPRPPEIDWPRSSQLRALQCSTDFYRCSLQTTAICLVASSRVT
jgi:hypothetical protein